MFSSLCYGPAIGPCMGRTPPGRTKPPVMNCTGARHLRANGAVCSLTGGAGRASLDEPRPEGRTAYRGRIETLFGWTPSQRGVIKERHEAEENLPPEEIDDR